MRYKSFLAMIMSLSITLGGMPVTASAAPTFPDMPEDWSTQALQNAVDNGYISGIDGKLEPNGKLTRAQMASIMNRVFTTTEKANLDAYTDVPQSAWYYDDMSKAVASGIFVGNSEKLNPQANITRQEAFSVLARAYNLADGNEASLYKFSDASEISSWAKGSVAALVEDGIVNGTDGKILPNAEITRAEFAVILYNANRGKTTDTQASADILFDKAGTYTKVAEGNVTVAVPGVELKDITITGNLILADGIGKGEVKLTNVIVEGDTFVQGGGENSIIIENCKLNAMEINNKVSPVRILSNSTKIKSITTLSNTTFEGDFDCNIKLNTDSVIIKGNFHEIDVEKTCNIIIYTGNIKKINVQPWAPDTSINFDPGSKVEVIDIRGTKTIISGNGKITLVTVGANDVTVSVPGTKVVVEKEVVGTKVAKIEIGDGKSASISGNNNGNSDNGNTLYRVEIVTVLDGIEDSSSTTQVAKNASLSKWKAIDKAGYLFKGLYTTSDFTTEYQLNAPVKGNLRLYAKYESAYVVTAKNYFFTVSPTGVYTYVGTEDMAYRVKENDALTLTTPLTLNGVPYKLDGIFDAITVSNGVPAFGTQYTDKVLVTTDMSVSARYVIDANVPTPTAYTVNVDNYYFENNNTFETFVAQNNKPYTVEKGEILAVDNPLIYEGNSYELEGLYENATIVNNSYSFTDPVSNVVVDGDMKFFAKYTKQTSSEPEPETHTVIVDTYYITVDNTGNETYAAKEAKPYTVEKDKILAVDNPLIYKGNSYELEGLYESVLMEADGPAFNNLISTDITVTSDMNLAAKYTRTVLPDCTVNIYLVINGTDLFAGPSPVKNGDAYIRDTSIIPETYPSLEGYDLSFKEIRIDSKDGPVYNNEAITADTSLYAIYEMK